MYRATDAATMLTYGVGTNPDPLQITPDGTTPANSTITVVVSNDTNKYVQCNSIAFAFPPGTYAKDLTNDMGDIGTTVPQDWGINRSGGTFTAAPNTADAGKIGPEGLSFVFTSVHVNSQVGTFPLTITEVTDQGGTLSTVINISKFPANFSIGDLNADPLIVAPGGSTILSWQGSASANYELEYGENSVPVSNTGPYQVDDLMTDTEFYLVVTLVVDDQTVEIQRERSVTVDRPQVIAFNGPQAEIYADQSATLSWTTLNAVSCELWADGVKLEGNVPLNTTGYQVSPTTTTTYTLYAYSQNEAAMDHGTWTVYYGPILLTVTPQVIEWEFNPDAPQASQFALNWQSKDVTSITITSPTANMNVGNVGASGTTTLAIPPEPTNETITWTASGQRAGGTVSISASAQIIYTRSGLWKPSPIIIKA